jgi:formylglycine-generating enzyme required for sulfatase activity
VLLSGALGVLAVGVWLGIYLQHRQRPSAQHPVLAAWNRAVDALDRADLGRLPTETPVEHAARLGTLELDAGRAQKALDAMATLADLAELALYSADPGGEREAHVATQLAEEVHETLRSRTNRIELHAASRRAALREGATR